SSGDERFRSDSPRPSGVTPGYLGRRRSRNEDPPNCVSRKLAFGRVLATPKPNRRQVEHDPGKAFKGALRRAALVRTMDLGPPVCRFQLAVGGADAQALRCADRRVVSVHAPESRSADRVLHEGFHDTRPETNGDHWAPVSVR